MMNGYNLIAFILGLSLLVIAMTVVIDVYTQPAVNAVRRAKDQHFHIPTWAERFQKQHMSNTHKHRRGH
jgi:hypothetical protein